MLKCLQYECWVLEFSARMKKIVSVVRRDQYLFSEAAVIFRAENKMIYGSRGDEW